MKQAERQAVLLSLIARLRERGSWCGETHIQKDTFFLQEGCDVPVEFNYIMYKHGPYSFDLNDELTAMRADGLLTVVPAEPYGAHLYPSEMAPTFLARFRNTVGRHAAAVERVARHMATKNVKELERSATALYVLRSQPAATTDVLAAEINRLKPHMSIAEATVALAEVRQFIDLAQSPA